MILAGNAVPEAPVSYASYAYEDGSELLKSATAKKEPGKERFSAYQFEQKVFPWEGGRYRLRLLENPTLILDPATVKFRVKDWGMELNVASAVDLPRLIVRRFLNLWSHAQNDTLSDVDAQAWGKIVGIVDMQDFAQQHSDPRYVEGRLVLVRDVLRVEWHDGSLCFIPREFASCFDLLNEGEYFSAFVKFGLNNQPVSISRVLPLAPPVAV